MPLLRSLSPSLLRSLPCLWLAQAATIAAHTAALKAVDVQCAADGPLVEGAVEARSGCAEGVFHTLHSFLREWEPTLLRPQFSIGTASAASASDARSPARPSLAGAAGGELPALFDLCSEYVPPQFPDGLFVTKKAAEIRRMFGFPPAKRS